MERFLWKVDLCLLFSNVYSDQTKVTLSSNTRRVEFSNSFFKRYTSTYIYINIVREGVNPWRVSLTWSTMFLHQSFLKR